MTDTISARLDRLPVTRTLRTLVVFLSLGGFFEFYDIFFSGYIAPGRIRSGILTPTTHGLFGLTGIAGFVDMLCSVSRHHAVHFRLRPQLPDPNGEFLLELGLCRDAISS